MGLHNQWAYLHAMCIKGFFELVFPLFLMSCWIPAICYALFKMYDVTLILMYVLTKFIFSKSLNHSNSSNANIYINFQKYLKMERTFFDRNVPTNNKNVLFWLIADFLGRHRLESSGLGNVVDFLLATLPMALPQKFCFHFSLN